MADQSLIDRREGDEEELQRAESRVIRNAVFVSVLTAFIFGYNIGIIGGISATIVEHVYFPDASSSEQSFYEGLLTASVLFGAVLGAFFSPGISDRMGRKPSLAWIAVLSVVFAVMLAVPIESFWWMFWCRALLGLMVGAASSIGPLYMSEIAPPHRAGQLGTVFQINVTISILISQIVNYSFQPNEDTIISLEACCLELGLGGIPGLFLIYVASCVIDESPKWLEKQALQVQGRLDSEGHGRNQRGKTGWQLLVSDEKWSIVIALILAASNQLTGINAIIFYAPYIFEDAGVANPLFMTVFVVGTWNMLSTLVSFSLVERVGRRKLMLVSTFGMAVSMFAIAGAYQMFPDSTAGIAIPGIMLFILGFETGPGSLFFVLCTEIFPARVKEEALGFANATQWAFNVVITFFFPVLTDGVGQSGTFLIIGSITVVVLVLIVLFIEETKDKMHDRSRAEAEAKTGANQSLLA